MDEESLLMDQQSGFLRWNLFLVKMLYKCQNDNKGFRILCKLSR